LKIFRPAQSFFKWAAGNQGITRDVSLPVLFCPGKRQCLPYRRLMPSNAPLQSITAPRGDRPESDVLIKPAKKSCINQTKNIDRYHLSNGARAALYSLPLDKNARPARPNATFAY
jgi:hypothetical protein